MKKKYPSVEAVKDALSEISKDVAAEIAVRIAAGDAIETTDERTFKQATLDKKQIWLREHSQQNNQHKRAA